MDISGSAITELFFKEAKTQLSTAALQLLLKFITTLSHSTSQCDLQRLQNSLSKNLNTFYHAETQITNEDSATLVRPSGPPDAILGLIMHCQSKEGLIDEFWDLESPTIQFLEQKGLSPSFIFGFDWHWRAEGWARNRRGSCPATSWSKDKLELHNGFSHQLLDILPLPLVIVAGACARKHYLNRVQKDSSQWLTLSVDSEMEINFSLEFSEARLRRMTVYVDHPAASFFQPSRSAEVSIRLDSAFNFFLYLLKIPHDTLTFSNIQQSIRRGVPGSAPFKELQGYIAKERNRDSILGSHEYTSSFLSYASRYLNKDVNEMLKTGESVAQAVRLKINSRLSGSFNDLNRARTHTINNRKKNAQRYGIEYKDFWDGQQVKVLSSGRTSLYLPTGPALTFTIPKSIRQAYLSNGKTPTIKFFSRGVALLLDTTTIFEISCEKLLALSTFGQRGVDHLQKELARQPLTL